MEQVQFANIKLQRGFWEDYEKLVRKVTIPAIYRQFADRFREVVNS